MSLNKFTRRGSNQDADSFRDQAVDREREAKEIDTMNAPSPETDAATCGKGYGIPGNTVTADFARKLERELNGSRKQIAELTAELDMLNLKNDKSKDI